MAIGASDVNKVVKLTIKNPISTAFPVEYVRIYRTEKDGNRFYEVDKVAVASAGSGATTVYTDKCETMANTYTAFMGEMSPEVLAFKQLAPMMKMDLATLGPVIRWMILLYGVPVLYAPKKFMRYTNIKADVPGNLGI